ncbi:MAG: peptide deformylase [Oscillospiraceae bacterium]|nr:peptide deformylase [Oscillospiraceae bacterium]
MIKELVHDPIFLAQSSEPADESDMQTAQDLLDTITAHKEACVGMAANMIGVLKRIIVFANGNGEFEIMYNPEIVKCSGAFQTEEGCLSLLGDPRPVKRFKSIKVKFQNAEFKERFKTFTGFTAQIIQHEIDHCNGILI